MSIRLATALAIAALGMAPAATPTAQEVSRVRFAATLGEAPLQCGVKYERVGTSKSTISVADFRFYVSRVRLLKADGGEQPIALTQDGLWQVDDVALLDFENATDNCTNGTEPTRDQIEGQVPPGAYVGLRFDLGLPFDKNHREATLQPSPLNLSRMFWSWNAGYKFLRMDLRTTGQPKGWMLHLGSTGCGPGRTPTTVPESCSRANVVTVDFPAFDASRDVVAFDVGSLLGTSDVDVNTPDTAGGCMSGPSDPECGPIFAQLGLPWGERQAGPQTVFRVQRPATVVQ